jgi:hypothetical protein
MEYVPSNWSELYVRQGKMQLKYDNMRIIFVLVWCSHSDHNVQFFYHQR